MALTAKINKIDSNGYWAVKPSGSNTWTNIFIPSTPCKIERSNVVGSSSGKDENGIMHIDWVRTDVRKIILHYNAISATELKGMEDLMQGKEFQFKFLQDTTGNVQTINAYAGESSYEHYSYSGLYTEPVYINYEIHVIEL